MTIFDFQGYSITHSNLENYLLFAIRVFGWSSFRQYFTAVENPLTLEPSECRSTNFQLVEAILSSGPLPQQGNRPTGKPFSQSPLTK